MNTARNKEFDLRNSFRMVCIPYYTNEKLLMKD